MEKSVEFEIADYIKEVLEMKEVEPEGYSPLTLAYIGDSIYDLIIMDIMMPKQNGYEATQAIRSMSDRPDGRTIPIVAMTANAFAEDIAAAHAAGMNGHLAKPIDMDEVMKVICRVLTGSMNMV